MSDTADQPKSRFLQGLATLGKIASNPRMLFVPQKQVQPPFDQGAYQVFRNACPRNCYDTCSIKTYVKDGAIQFVEGAPESTFTNGGLCVKGQSYTRRPYSPDRIKYPMMQDGRRSGKWRRISWDEAMEHIAKKILQIKAKDGNLLGLGMTKYSGNFGITNFAVEGLMSSLGYTTRFVGTPCWPAGIDAQHYDFGAMKCNDPEDMVHAKYIIVWGGNPAWCSIHSMKYIMEAQRNGATVVVIDPVLTQTAAKSDIFLQVKPAADGALALGMAKHIVDAGLVDTDFVMAHSHGYEDFVQYLNTQVTLEWAAEQSGISIENIKRVAEGFAKADPATIWIGYGMQRHTNGGASVRAIDALVAMTGNIGKVGGGARYASLDTWGFTYHAMSHKAPQGSVGMLGEAAVGEFHGAVEEAGGEENITYANRTFNINKTAQAILDADNPKIQMLWVSCKNPLAQDFDRPKLLKAFDGLDMVVSVEQFFTETVENSDIVLPVTTLFEEWTVNVSYWHRWLSINEQAIAPMYEAKSNIEIAAALSRKMNELAPGSCTFPQEVDTKEWTAKEFNQDVYDLFGLQDWTDLLQGPAKAKFSSSAAWADKIFPSPSGKYEFLSETCASHGHKALPEFLAGRESTAPFRLLTAHSKFSLHSQFAHLDWMKEFHKEPYVYMHPESAKSKGIVDMDMVRVFNTVGEQCVKVKLTDNVARDCLLMYEVWYGSGTDFNVQNLVDDTAADMGNFKAGAPGVAIHSQFAHVEKV